MLISLLRPRYRSHLITPPLGIGYISSYLNANGFKTKIIDGLNLGLSHNQLADCCADADIVGVSVLSSYLQESIDIVSLLKARGKTVIIGGPHVTASGMHALEETGADYAVCGEGEKSLLEIVKKISLGSPVLSIPGVLKAGAQMPLSKRGLIEDLDTIPFPDWRALNPQLYKKAPHGGLIKHFPVAPIVTSRGCPYECTFCASPQLWERTIRFRSAENTVDEIEYLVKDFNVREIHFEDDNLTLKAEHITKICELIMRKKIKISWATPNGVRADTIDKDMIKLMRRSGCYYLAFGIESANKTILSNIKKRTRIEIIQRAITLARKEGIITQGFFIFGLPGETQKTISETIDFACESGLDRAQFLILDVLPGSELWGTLKSQRYADIKSARSYQDVTWIPEGVNREILLQAQSDAFKRFFLRPRQLFSLIKYFKFSQVSFIAERLHDYRILIPRKES